MRKFEPAPARRRRRRLGGLLVIAVTTLLAALLLGGGSHTPGAVAAGAAPTVTLQTDDSPPAHNVILLGSSPGEAPGETWGIGGAGSFGSEQYAIVRYSSAQQEWSQVPGPLAPGGAALVEFRPDRTDLTGAIANGGAGLLLGSAKEEASAPRKQMLVLRNPGGQFTEVPLTAEGGEGSLLKEGEQLFVEGRTPTDAVIEENGHAGAFVVPVETESSANNTHVLHYDGEAWSSEPIEIPTVTTEEGGGLHVLAVAASSPQNAWLLAQLSSASDKVALFNRRGGSWHEVNPAPLEDEGQPFDVVGGEAPTGQILSVTSQGLWIDGEQTEAHEAVTMFFSPEGEGESAESGRVVRAWCGGEQFSGCDEAMEEALPSGSFRSFAWANPTEPYGERVIAGFSEGITMRLEGGHFVPVLGIGGSDAPNDVGGSDGAAFSSPDEGWLGNEFYPEHLTTSPAPDELENYPVPFQHALTAIAPAPEQPVGALSSEALAVGDDGEVARWLPSQGWVPETLFGPGSRRETPRLRAVAWPRASRAYAVGALGEMWLWRSETGLWEKDPATPINFQGNLLGIAFDPGDSNLGYAVGQQGVLLRYGKTWVQEPEEAIPAPARGASFTSVAFAGGEAIVAFRKMHQQGEESASSPAHYTGGLLVNNGSGWEVDEQAAQAIGAGVIPWAVAGLPDGGAAVAGTEGGIEGQGVVIERQSAGGPWEATPPYPGSLSPGSLAIFREGGAVRVIGAGYPPETALTDERRPVPTGFPPNLIEPYPLSNSPRAAVVRQNSSGWVDEEHNHNPALEPPGEYKLYDQVFNPDPTAAVLVNEAGSAGWAVGGYAAHNPALDTADVSRYPAEAALPSGVGASPVEPNKTYAAMDSTQATFAIGGQAQCVAACSGRALAGVGPDTWLESALHEAEEVPDLRAFLFTGPRVTSGAGAGVVGVPWAREYDRYSEVLASAGGSAPAFPVTSPTDAGTGSECLFQEAFAGFSEPVGKGAAFPEVSAIRSESGCSTYYAFKSKGPGTGGTVRVVVIDTSAHADWAAEKSWLAGELSAATASREPAIVVGSANLNAEIAERSTIAAETAQTIIAGHASAYFYDAPEENVKSMLDGSSTPAFGSGTLGYVDAVKAEEADFIGANGFLLVHVDVAARNPENNVAPVTVRLIPNIGELAMEAEDGTLLRRSQVASFSALARRPRAGGRSQRFKNQNESNLYIPLPENCVGTPCANRIKPEYSFSSSNTEVGDFVAPNTASSEPHAVELDPKTEKPIHDSESGLFCAYNKGELTVSIEAGGLKFSQRVVIQAGSVRRPCGTVPIKATQSEVHVPTNPPPSQPLSPETTPSATPPLPAPPLPVAVTPAPKPTPPPAVPLQPGFSTPVFTFLPPPPPTAARPSPPTGTSAVTSPIEIAEKEEESEEAPESVSNQASAYHPAEHEPAPEYLIGIVLLFALAGAGVARRRPGRREVRVAHATVNTSRSQRRISRDR